MFIAFIIVTLFLATSTFAQNTKGDKAASNTNRVGGQKPKKEKRGRSSNNQNARFINNNAKQPNAERSVSNRSSLSRLKRLQGSSANHATRNRNRPVNPNATFWNRSKKTENATTRDLSGKSLRRKNYSTPRPKVYASTGIKSAPQSSPPGRKRKVVPRTASRSFIKHKTINANAGFWNVKKKGERAVTTDLAGKPLRTRNYRTPKQKVIPSNSPYVSRQRIGDRAYKGTLSGRAAKTSPRSRQGAWRGDVAGRNIRRKNFTSKKRVEGRPVLRGPATIPGGGDWISKGTMPGVGHKSATKHPETRAGKAPLPVRLPGIGGNGVGYAGNIKRQRPLKGGGSSSGRLWNNQGTAIQPRPPGIGALGIGGFQGNIKGQRPFKGGGSRSGRLWNNQGSAIQPKPPGIGALGVGGFKGNIKGQRPLKGGGSRSGKLWNNKGIAVEPRAPGIGAHGLGGFQGNIKGQRPLKGGGSRSGKLWNNKGIAVEPRAPGIGAHGLGNFQGNVKAGRPLKGGGSISGKLWNNKATAIPVKLPPASAAQVGGLPVKRKLFEDSPGFFDQGETFTGYIKLPRFNRGYTQNPKASEESLLKRKLKDKAFDVDGLGIKAKRRAYVANKKNASEDALLKLEPTKTTNAVGNLQIKVKRRDYIANKNASENALYKLRPTAGTEAVNNLQIKVKQYNYIHNNSSSKDALNVREPGKAFARAADYQGNIKMKKFELFNHRKNPLHPDAQFVKINKNNVPEERDLLTNFKLWWGRNFRKNETQPENLKEKKRSPRYDKGELGIWNE